MKKNIAIIVQKLTGGGAERTAANLSIILSKYYTVHLIVFDGRVISYQYDGILHDIKMPPRNSRLGKIVNVIKRVITIKTIKKENNIFASVSLMDGANLVNALSKSDDKVFTSIRIQMSAVPARGKNGKLKKAQLRKMKFIANKSAKVVAISNGVDEDLIENFGVPNGKVVTIYNPCDGELLREKAQVHIDDASTLPVNSVITMGRLTPQKGQWHLIRAFAEVIKTVSDAKLYILGQGSLERELKQLAHDLGLDDHVIFLGFVEAPHAYIMKSRVFVFPSLYEGFGNAPLEAMACGTPCISTDCYSGPREILAPGTKVEEHLSDVEYAEYGVLTSVGDKEHFNSTDPLTEDEKQLVKAIVKMLQNDSLYKKYSEKALNRSKDFSPEKIANDWISLIEK